MADSPTPSSRHSKGEAWQTRAWPSNGTAEHVRTEPRTAKQKQGVAGLRIAKAWRSIEWSSIAKLRHGPALTRHAWHSKSKALLLKAPQRKGTARHCFTRPRTAKQRRGTARPSKAKARPGAESSREAAHSKGRAQHAPAQTRHAQHSNPTTKMTRPPQRGRVITTRCSTKRGGTACPILTQMTQQPAAMP